MPGSIFLPPSGGSVAKPTATFTGEVFVDLVHKATNAGVGNVTFTPCARSHWHTHEGGQLIKVVSGTGWICDKGGEARRIKAGDTIWAEPGTTHWHGADDGSILTHFVVGIGATTWLEPVTDEEYLRREKE
ncbi:unnamed protein product [Clonostachys rosea f. rosea IK726]|jgi:quercetin dioxygenase-like cupin family protein|uniref:Uncharacterized protein n=1 Tax=Clonostachys rosea f. rosea IK726 TaxID=1349383 RepID=A0ACA9T5Q2_BIOOC|nr:unnamed protein product [Clonostachys rosea f. rosea IK726]